MSFVAELNIARFRKLLEAEENAAKRAILAQLLSDEVAKSTISRVPRVGDPASPRKPVPEG